MFLESALAADTRVKILRTLFQEALPQLDVTALSRETGKSVAGVHKALAELLPTRVVLPLQRGRTTYHAANADSAWFPQILNLFRLERDRTNAPHLFPTYWNHLEPIVGHVGTQRGALALLLYGGFVRPPVYPTADVDLLLVFGDKAPRPRVEGTLLGHKLSPVVLNQSSFEQKARGADAFLAGVLERHLILYQDPAYEFPWTKERTGFYGRRQRRWVEG